MKFIIKSENFLSVIDKCITFATNNNFDPEKSFSKQSGLTANEILKKTGCEYEVQKMNKPILTLEQFEWWCNIGNLFFDEKFSSLMSLFWHAYHEATL